MRNDSSETLVVELLVEFILGKQVLDEVEALEENQKRAVVGALDFAALGKEEELGGKELSVVGELSEG